MRYKYAWIAKDGTVHRVPDYAQHAQTARLLGLNTHGMVHVSSGYDGNLKPDIYVHGLPTPQQLEVLTRYYSDVTLWECAVFGDWHSGNSVAELRELTEKHRPNPVKVSKVAAIRANPLYLAPMDA